MTTIDLPSGVALDIDRRGPADGPTVLLIMGLGGQRIWWPDELLDDLAGRGFDVITFDNRDVGESTRFGEHGKVGVQTLMAGFTPGGLDGVEPPYLLEDMAADAVALLDELDIDRAHVVGISMGGMIAQHVAFGHPDRVASLTSIMSTTGNPEVGQSTPEAAQVLFAPPASDREAAIEQGVAGARVVASPTLFDEARARERVAAAYDRAFYPEGVGRQLLAVLKDEDRTERLAGVRAPTLVIHGEQDPLINVSGGRATAEAIDGARLVVLDEMGHDLPLPLIGRVADEIAAHVRRAEERAVGVEADADARTVAATDTDGGAEVAG